jgi:thioesterase domain-containing protein
LLLFESEVEQFSSRLRSSDESPSFESLVRICQERSLIPAETSIDEVEQYLDRYRINLLAGNNYVAHPIPTPLHLFLASDDSPGTLNPSRLRNWEMILPEEQIRTISVPGTHFSLMRPPHIAVLGKELSRSLRQARENGDLQP